MKKISAPENSPNPEINSNHHPHHCPYRWPGGRQALPHSVKELLELGLNAKALVAGDHLKSNVTIKPATVEETK